MARGQWMRRFAKWHIWLGWLVGVPVLMWTLSGLVMVAKPIEEVRGNHLRVDAEETALPPGSDIAISLPDDPTRPVSSVRTEMDGDRAVTTFTYGDGTIERYLADGTLLPPLTEVEARLLVAQLIKGGDQVVSSTGFKAAEVPLDFRKPMDVWQVALADGTHVYVGMKSGRIEAVRTRWWRFYDFMWGLHIMDLQTREDNSHPILILFAVLAALGALLGCVLMFRHRKTRRSA